MEEEFLFDAPKNNVCTNCHKHRATQIWIGDGNMMSVVHGQYTYWCDCCCLKAQIDNAEERARALKGLKKKLAKVTCKNIEQ